MSGAGAGQGDGAVAPVGPGAGPSGRNGVEPSRESRAPARPRETLEAFFEAENGRDWEVYAGFLHPDVEWTVGGRTITGREDYVRAMRAAYAGSDVRFRVHQSIESADGRVVATLLVNSEGRRSLDVFELSGGVVVREWEFLLGAGPDWDGEAVPAA